jgi:twitching motility protein PilT
MVSSSEGVSDLLFAVGKPPVLEEHGVLEEFPIDTPTGVLAAEQINQIADHIMNGDERLKADLARHGSCDCSYALTNLARMRVNIFTQNGRPAIVMRKLQTEIPTLDQLALPPIFREMIKEKNGIIFITGATGSGKTTTLAAMLNELNATQKIHILTLEDPIEFLHPHQQALFNQRQLGNDFPDFARGLRAALRQAPKAILVGEIRDRETMEIAMTAAETGHLVFSTLHTINAGQSLNRILGFFSRDEETQIRQRFADTLRYIVSQRLVSKKEGGRLLISEIMGSNLRTRETIRYGESETKNFHEIIDAATTLGWLTFDQSLLRACEADLVTEETAMLYCTNKSSMHRELDLLAKRQGEHRREHSSGLKLDRPRAPMANRVITPCAKPLTDAVSRPG